jgi:hypothetical protein
MGCPNQTCLKLIRNLTTRRICLQNFSPCTKPERFFEVPLKLSSSQHYLTYFYFLKYPKIQPTLPLPTIYQYSSSLKLLKRNHIRKTTKTSFPPSFSRPLFPLKLLVPWELRKYSPPIHGLIILQKPMRIENDFPSNGF